MIETQKQKAEDFLKKTKTEIAITFLKYDYHFIDDNTKRDIYEVTLKRGDRRFKFLFGNSVFNSGEYEFFGYDEYNNFIKTKIHLKRDKNNKPIKNYNHQILNNGNSKKNINFKIPDAYDILSCLTLNNPEDFKNFCSGYGYNEDSIKALKIYEAVLNEYNNLKMLYNEEELNLLRAIEE